MPPYRLHEFDGFEILVGKGAHDNDELTFQVAKPLDFWLHAAGYAGSHVVVRNPDELKELPAEVLAAAAQLAAYHSKARNARGKVEVHLCHAGNVTKPRHFPAGTVRLKGWKPVKVYPRDPFGDRFA